MGSISRYQQSAKESSETSHVSELPIPVKKPESTRRPRKSMTFNLGKKVDRIAAVAQEAIDAPQQSV